MNKQILGAKKAAEEQSKPYKDRVAKLERELETLSPSTGRTWGRRRAGPSPSARWGSGSRPPCRSPGRRRRSRRSSAASRTRQMMDCIVVKEDVSKEALKKYGEDTVNAVGATWKQQDVFGYELNFSKLEQVKAGL